MLNKLLKQDYTELNNIKNKIVEFTNKTNDINAVIEELKTNIKIKHHQKELILNTGDVSKMAEVKKINKDIEKRESEINDYIEMLEGVTAAFNKTMVQDLNSLTVDNEKRRITECAEVQAELKEQFEELIFKQWKIYDQLNEVEKSYRNFNNELRYLYNELNINTSKESNPSVYRVFEYSSVKSPIATLYDCQNLIFKGFTPGPSIEIFMRGMAEKLEEI